MGFFDSFNLVDLAHPDDNTDRSVNSASNLGDEQARIGREQLQFAKDRAARLDPKLQEGLDLQSGIASDARARANEMGARGTEQYNRYKSTFAPIEDKMASDAMNFDSPAQMDRAAQVAGADVTRSYGDARAGTGRSLSRMGVNPNSGRAIRSMSDLGLSEAAANAGAQTGARERTRTQGIALRADAANYGKSLPMPSATPDSSLALAGAQGLVSSAGTAIQAPLAAANTAQPWFTGASSSIGTSGNLALGEYGQRLSVGKELLGEGLGAAGMIFSSKKLKEDKAPMDGDFVLEGLENLPVESWKYKAGVEDGGRHVGPYAEDVNREFGERAAPGGNKLDIATMNGLALRGIQELAKKVRKLEEKGGLHMAKASRDTEPRRSA